MENKKKVFKFQYTTILKNLVIFLLSIFILDLFLSMILDKDIYNLINNKIDIIPSNKSNKQVDWAEISDIWSVPFWDSEYRGPYFDYKKEKTLNCRVVWLWDSIIWGSWVKWEETYMKYLNDKINNSEFINMWIPWSDLLQQIIKYNKESLKWNNDLLIWHIWEDDAHVYKNINWVLYDSRIILNDLWDIFLFNFIPENINLFLLKKSYFYNELIKLKYKGNFFNKKTDNFEYVLLELDKFIKENYLENNKILILFSPSLSSYTYKSKFWWDYNWYPMFYNEIQWILSKYKNTDFIYLDTFFNWVDVESIRYDDCCHFNSDWHKIIADKLYDYIKTNKILDEKCY